MTSTIDPTVPVYGNPTTESVRRNFAIARSEISELQDREWHFLPLTAGERFPIIGELNIRMPNEPAMIFWEADREPTEGRRWSISVLNGNFGVDLDTSGNWSDYQTLLYLRWDDRSVRFAGNVDIANGLGQNTFLQMRHLAVDPDEGGSWRFLIGPSGNFNIQTGAVLGQNFVQFRWAERQAVFFAELIADNFPRLAELEARIATLEARIGELSK